MEVLFPDGIPRVSQEDGSRRSEVRCQKDSSKWKSLPTSDLRLPSSWLSVYFLILKLQTFMPHYHTLGNIPHKRHTQFRKPDGTLYSEQLFSTEGFSNDYSLLYHCHPPTQIIKTEPQIDVSPQV